MYILGKYFYLISYTEVILCYVPRTENIHMIFHFLFFTQTTSDSKLKKKATKTKEAKKILKRKFKVNTKIVFTEDGEVRLFQYIWCMLAKGEFVFSVNRILHEVYFS